MFSCIMTQFLFHTNQTECNYQSVGRLFGEAGGHCSNKVLGNKPLAVSPGINAYDSCYFSSVPAWGVYCRWAVLQTNMNYNIWFFLNFNFKIKIILILIILILIWILLARGVHSVFVCKHLLHKSKNPYPVNLRDCSLILSALDIQWRTYIHTYLLTDSSLFDISLCQWSTYKQCK